MFMRLKSSYLFYIYKKSSTKGFCKFFSDKIVTIITFQGEKMKKVVVLAVFLSFMLIGCSGSKKQEETTQEVKTEKVAPVVEKKSEPVAKKEVKKPVKKVEKSIVKKSEEITKKAVEKVQKTAQAITKKSKEIASMAGDNETVKKITKKIEKSTKAITSMIPASLGGLSSQAKSGGTDANAKKLFAKCAGCHGQKAQKKALGVSKIINKLSADEIKKALNGYKKGTFGGAMKGVMQGQVSNLSEKDIKDLAKYIPTLK